MQPIEMFMFLQLMDFLTTLIGFRLGAAEVSPFVRMLTELGPTAGVLLSKGIAIGLGAACVGLRKFHVIGWINYWYAGLVLWNFGMIFRALQIAS